jgi:hypothetical protein
MKAVPKCGVCCPIESSPLKPSVLKPCAYRLCIEGSTSVSFVYIEWKDARSSVCMSLYVL